MFKGNPNQMMQQFPRFMQQMRGKDPAQIINQMVQSGQINQRQLNQVQQQAQQLQGTFDSIKNMFGF